MGCKVRPTLEQTSGVGPRDALALTTLEEGVGVVGFASFVVPRVVSFVGEVQSEFLHHAVDAIHGAEQDGGADALLNELCCGAKYRFVVAFGEDDALAPSFDLVDHLTHDGVGLAQSCLELFPIAVDVEFLGGHASDAFVHRSLCDGGSLPNQHTTVKRFGDDVLGPVLHDDAVVSR